MSFAYFVPKVKEDPWKAYWSKAEIEKEIKSCERDELLDIIRKFIKKDDRIIDAGCGLGRWIIYLSKQGYDVTGVDNFKEALDKLNNFDSSLKLNVADIKNLPFTDNYFDAYLSFGVVEHDENGPKPALEEARRVLRKGGVIILETPCDNLFRRLTRVIIGLKSLVKKLVGWKSKPEPEKEFYEYRFQNKELRKILTDLDFKIIDSFSKDLKPRDQSISLWSDFPKLRHGINQPFKLNKQGQLLKKNLTWLKPIFTGCTVVVAQKL